MEEAWKGRRHHVVQHRWQRKHLHSQGCCMRWAVVHISICDMPTHHGCRISLHSGVICCDLHASGFPLQSPDSQMLYYFWDVGWASLIMVFSAKLHADDDLTSLRWQFFINLRISHFQKGPIRSFSGNSWLPNSNLIRKVSFRTGWIPVLKKFQFATDLSTSNHPCTAAL